MEAVRWSPAASHYLLLGPYSCSSSRENHSSLGSDFKSWPYTDLHTSKLDQAFAQTRKSVVQAIC